MKADKLFAGLSAVALAGTMLAAIPAQAETTELYNVGFNIQVGHVKNAKISVKVKSSDNTIWNGADGVSEGYMYTVQKSWNCDAPADDEYGEIPFTFDGSPQKQKGATFLNNWDTGPTKFNGQWAQITLTDPDLSKLTFEVTFVADSNSKWEYHPYDEDDEKNELWTFIFAGGDSAAFAPETVSVDVINSQFGGLTSSNYKDEDAIADAESKGIQENGFYNAAYTAKYTYSGADLAKANPEKTPTDYEKDSTP